MHVSYDAVQNKQYLVDVDTAIAQAVSYFDSLGEANRTQAVVFDIDETALSNLPVSGAAMFFEFYDCLLSHDICT